MPPFVARKRRKSTPPPEASASILPKRPTLFDALDKPPPSPSVHDNKRLLEGLVDSTDDSSLSDVSSSEFEDALPAQKRRKVAPPEEEDEDEELDWEDAIRPSIYTPDVPAAGVSGDLELTLGKHSHIDFSAHSHGKKKGPSKRERQIRVATHCMHVQFLLFHNLMRNSWVCDKDVQSILLGKVHKHPKLKEIVRRWRHDSGLEVEPVEETLKPSPKGRKRHGKGRNSTSKPRTQRDWGPPAERHARGEPNMSRGDPVIILLKTLARYWKKSFTITAPGLRKQGYKSLAELETEVSSFKNDKHNPEEHGEKIENLKAFRNCARAMEGSRDVGAQLFTALIRGLGIDARLVASLQPVGFGWSKGEEASKKKKTKRKSGSVVDDPAPRNGTSESDMDDEDHSASAKASLSTDSRNQGQPRTSQKLVKVTRLRGAKDTPIAVTDDNEASDGGMISDDTDDSIIDVTPSIPKRRAVTIYDKDVTFPTYWTEVASPVTNEVYPVDPLVLGFGIATGQDQLPLFEPRGSQAEKTKQVIAYVVGFSADGTAKDVTTRYLKRHMWPGRTKGSRMPAEKVPVLNKKGKVKRYEIYDWFKTVMSGYERSSKDRTAVDDLEDAQDLRPVKPEKKETKEGEESLQWYKSSAEFVLERHLRREEAIIPGSKAVKTFVAGKGDKAKEEPVFLRKHVMVCRTSESWHKEGREVKPGAQPMKMVPVRAVTLTKKREVEEAERETGEKMKQGLYARDQTEWIIPPPIENGVIPKNAYGNMDCFAPSMIPEGAVHIPMRKTMGICKKLGVDYAEAVTGFEFGNKRAVPVIEGVVVAAENEQSVIDAWEKDEEERRIKAEGKREKIALMTWRKFLMGLRIVERVREEYGGDADAHMKEEMNPFTNKSKQARASKANLTVNPVKQATSEQDEDEDMAGGFVVDEEEMPGGFLTTHDDDESQGGGGFIVENGAPDPPTANVSAKPHINGFKRDADEAEDSYLTPIPASGSKGTSKRITTARSTLKKSANGSMKRSKTKNPASPDGMDLDETEDMAFTIQIRPRSSRKAASNGQMSRAPPKRSAARRSETAVKSHFFAQDDTEATKDDEDESELIEPASEESEAGVARTSQKGGVTKLGRNTTRVIEQDKTSKSKSVKAPAKKARGRPRKTM
ncbi:hypothetical protein MMC09_000826 [Bachmanniomyces sp. S44760]|nr:hypothetical protein [Bachmanniomyces sp. S44760]